ncbi:MAG: DUF192 domain-containing protein [Chloroflexi bacterium]|nr:DUF192 domain-containing protein [Chloroflexota bacterium]
MMRVYNRTRDAVLVFRGRVANTFWTRLRGLIATPPLEPGEGLLLLPSRGIHSWFMSYPIDVLYLDSQGRVVDVEEHVSPWRVGRPRWRAHMVLEVPAGMVRATNTQVGDVLDVRY